MPQPVMYAAWRRASPTSVSAPIACSEIAAWVGGQNKVTNAYLATQPGRDKPVAKD